MQNANPFGDNDWKDTPAAGGSTELVQWVASRVEYARKVRDTKYAGRWAEYTRLWRGFWAEGDKNVESERSRLIAPALQQAVEMTVAEMEEAVFGRTAWFDITDDIADQNKDDAVVYRDQLLEDFALDGVPDGISKVFLLGALYGTGIAKINVSKKAEKSIHNGKEVSVPRISVTLEAIRPDEFVIDASALNVDEALFVAHEMIKPLHGVRAKQASGMYKQGKVYAYTGEKSDTDGTGEKARVDTDDNGVLITEYFGKVPASLLNGSGAETSEEGVMVEAIVTIANEKVLLRAVESPFTMKDRPIIAYQHDTVPGEFWGRGVSEKGYNPQKALDAELRARIDVLALITSPMMGADITRLPRNPDMRVKPGKTIFTRGRPTEIYEQISFADPAILAHTFNQSGDLERMVQQGTGAMDSATPVGINSRNETASGMSQMQSGFIKRSKRTMQNLERQFLSPLVRRSLWRYMQFDAARYPVDMKFVVNATMGIMAREVENSALINMLGFLQPEDPARKVVIQAIFDNSASANKKELKAAIEAMNAPPDPKVAQAQQQMQDAQLRLAVATAEEMEGKAEKAKADADLARANAKLAIAKANHEDVKASLEDDLVDIQAANAVTGAEKTRVAHRMADAAHGANIVADKKARSQGGS